MKLSRSSILFAIVAVALLSSLPGTIERLAQTGDPYLFTKQFFQDMLARLTGPGRLRFILQPTMAIIIGARQGVKDAHANLPPFLWTLAFHASHRRHALRTAFTDIRDLIAIAILLDMISQALIFHDVHPGAAVLLGPVLIAVPYSVARELANRIARARRPRATAAGSV
jgi:ribose/xylose/arabinose/galactoside ABC-type transport system permease subunit